ncbi:ribosomal protein S19 family protein, partial [Flavobacteriales bacterium]|nr:ribosomal protein S19 family protein [Flavobacteriales bacterium]
MSRSLKKPPFVYYKLYKKLDKVSESGKKTVIKTWSRAST